MTEVFEKKVAELNLDRSDWQLVKFGDVAIQQKQTVDRENTALSCFVKGEHLYSEDLHLRKWWELKDEFLGPAFIRKFEEGDILYGSRRTYLRKVVIAPFDGITSNTTFVIKANEEKIDRKLLPYILLSEGFSQHSIKNSKGSVNPYVNWKDLAGYEFLLPPIQTQKVLSELFLRLDNFQESNLLLKEKASKYFDSLIIERTSKKNVPFKELGSLVDTPINNGVFKKRDCFGKGTLLVNVTDIYGSFEVNPAILDRVEVNEKELNSFSAIPGDIIFNRSSLVLDGIGHSCLIPDHKEEMVFECHLMRVRPNKELINSRYLCRYCLSPLGKKYLLSRSQTTTMTTINQDALNKMPIPLPPIEEQIDIANRLDDVEAVILSVNLKISSIKKLIKSIGNQVF
jgi:restriction endonuclease S subunit